MQLTQREKANIFGGLVGAIIFGLIFIALFYTNKKKENWKITTGTITYSLDLERPYHLPPYARYYHSTPLATIYINYQYKVEGKSYNQFEALDIYPPPDSQSDPTKYRLHNKIPVKYNPENPSQSLIDGFQNDFFADQYNNNLLILGIWVFPLLLIIPLFIVGLRKNWNTRWDNISYKKTD